jgi:hypothetical protein
MNGVTLYYLEASSKSGWVYSNRAPPLMTASHFFGFSFRLEKRATKNSPGIELILDNRSGKVTYMDKKGIAAKRWKNVVFGRVIRKWLKILDHAEAEIDTWSHSRTAYGKLRGVERSM